jgi:hypothetical protein
MPAQQRLWLVATSVAALSPKELDIKHKTNRRNVGCGFLFGA